MRKRPKIVATAVISLAREAVRGLAPLRVAVAQWGAAVDAMVHARLRVEVTVLRPVVTAVAATVAAVVAVDVAIVVPLHAAVAVVTNVVAAASQIVLQPVLVLRYRAARFAPTHAARTVLLPVRPLARHQVVMAHAAATAWGHAVLPVRVVHIAVLLDAPLRAATILAPIPAMPNVPGLAT